MLVKKWDRYSKDTAGFDFAEAFVGRGLLTSEGEEWKRDRRLAQPAFHPSEIAQLVPMMAGVARGLAARWHGASARGEAIDAAQDFTLAALEVIGQGLLGSDFGGEAGTALRTSIERSMLRAPMGF